MMKSWKFITLTWLSAVSGAIGLLLLILYFSPNSSESIPSKTSRSIAEYGYFEGQKDALKGDVRIAKENGKWVWKKSCWDNGKETSFVPPELTEEEKVDE